jgi:hypothetical protein
MTIALFGISSIYNGIQKFMSAATHLQGSAPLVQTPSIGNSSKTQMHAKQRALRVLRVSEHGQTPHCAGRMVISGRMSDVCAELDRLVALEAQKKPTLTH